MKTPILALNSLLYPPNPKSRVRRVSVAPQRGEEVLGLSLGAQDPPALGAVTLLSPSISWNGVKATGALRLVWGRGEQ